MTTLEIVNNLTAELEELQAHQEVIAATGQAVDAQHVEVQRVLKELRQAKLRAEGEKLALETKHKQVTTAAENYFRAIESVREVLGPQGELAETVRTGQVQAIANALNRDSEEEVIALRSQVQEYDADIEEKRDDVETYLQALINAQAAYDGAKKKVEVTAKAILGLAEMAKGTAEEAKADLKQLKEALEWGGNYRFQAVVHLHDLMRRCENLGADIDLDKEPPGFGASEQNQHTLFEAVNKKWTDAKEKYVNAGDKLWGKNGAIVKLFDAQNALAEAEARRATRVTDAAKSVEEAYDVGTSEGGGPSETEPVGTP